MTDLQLDETPQPSDWQDLNEMFSSIRSFMKEHPGHILLNADDPGFGVGPDGKPISARIGRIGFCAFRERPPELVGQVLRDEAGQPTEFDEQMRRWTITLARVRHAYNDGMEPTLAAILQSSKGRQKLAASLSGKPIAAEEPSALSGDEGSKSSQTS